MNLPAIRDLAEIPYPVARALIGYAIHEVAHIRETDFDAIIRAIDEGRMEPDKLIKKFENAIEDYRIERITSQQFPGSVDDLTALRNMIHPPLTWLKPEWMRSEEHTSELQSLMRISYAVFCLKKKKITYTTHT